MLICTQCKRLLATGSKTCPGDGGAPEDVTDLPAGARVGSYKIVRLLGEGGMGFVYEALHEVLGRRTAIKLLRPELVANTSIVARFLQEAKAVNIIDHDHIVKVYDYGDGTDGTVYFVMEYLEGETLADLLARFRPAPLSLTLHVFIQIARALGAAHDKQIIHRDLKPANVFIVRRDDDPFSVKLLDFGVAKLRGDGSVALTRAGAIMGTPQYMAPEQMSAQPIDARADLFSLGVMLYRAVVGQIPFKGESLQEIAVALFSDTPPAPRQANPSGDIPPRLDKLIVRLISKEPSDRPANTTEVIAELERIKKDAGITDAAVRELVPEGPTQHGQVGSAPSVAASVGIGQHALGASGGSPPRKSRAVLFGALGGVVAVGAALGIVFAGRGSNKPDPGGPPSTLVMTSAPASEAARPKTIKELDPAGAKLLAEKNLRALLADADLAVQARAVEALALVGTPRAAPLLYGALESGPEVRRLASHALRDLAIPDAAPKIRAVLDRSGDRLRVELAADLVALGDRDGLAILRKAAGDPGGRLVAAVGLAGAGEADAARPVLQDIVDGTPPGRETWRIASGGLVKLGDDKARAGLSRELAQPDAVRAVAAAEVLALAGDEPAKAYLARVVADETFARRGEAALVLARLGDPSALSFVTGALKSADAGDRRLAIATAARLAKQGGDAHRDAIAALATDDPDATVRATAEAALLGM
jgi:HEAT repeat protein/tRNA A-37 threonylcarbamoyl transferase component Bud32